MKNIGKKIKNTIKSYGRKGNKKIDTIISKRQSRFDSAVKKASPDDLITGKFNSSPATEQFRRQEKRRIKRESLITKKQRNQTYGKLAVGGAALGAGIGYAIDKKREDKSLKGRIKKGIGY